MKFPQPAEGSGASKRRLCRHMTGQIVIGFRIINRMYPPHRLSKILRVYEP